MFDRFTIVEAWHMALSVCHNGQNSPEYKRLCRLQRIFKPSIVQRSVEHETYPEYKRIYDNACERLLNRSCRFQQV